MNSHLLALRSEDRKRSRAYPVLDLGAAYDLLCGKLLQLGNQELDRRGLAQILGYTSAAGGAAARKIGALVQFGFLDRHSGLYGLSPRGRRLQDLDMASPEYRSIVQNALERPVLFRRILDRYRPAGHIPADLARVLVRDFDITSKASEDAADIFFRSARFAGVLDSGGSFLAEGAPPQSTEQPRRAQPPATDPGQGSLFMTYPLTHGKDARLVFPPGMTDQDLLTLIDRLRFDIEHENIRKFLDLDKPADGRLLDGSFKDRSGKKVR